MATSVGSKQQRLEHYEQLRTTMKNQGFQEKQRSISILKANFIALLTAGPIVVLCAILFFARWGEFHLEITLAPLFFFAIAMIVMIAVHEFLHGLTWSFFCEHKWNSIHIGVIWKMLTPYCHCKEALKGGAYLLGALMPLLVLGFGVFAVALVTGSFFLFLLSMVNMLGAGGDMMMALWLLKYHDALIVDHPEECGFSVFYK